MKKTISWIKRATIIAKRKGYIVNGKGEIISPFGKKLKLQNYSKKGIFYARFKIKGVPYVDKILDVQVHQFVAYIKFGKKFFEPNIHVRHLNGNSLDNSWDNIALGSPSENMMDVPEELRIKRARHAATFQKSLTDDQVREFRKDRENGFTYSQLMAKYNISKSAVSFIVNKKTYKDII